MSQERGTVDLVSLNGYELKKCVCVRNKNYKRFPTREDIESHVFFFYQNCKSQTQWAEIMIYDDRLFLCSFCLFQFVCVLFRCYYSTLEYYYYCRLRLYHVDDRSTKNKLNPTKFIESGPSTFTFTFPWQFAIASQILYSVVVLMYGYKFSRCVLTSNKL